MVIKTFRGLIASGSTEQISLSTNNGLTGYRIIKLQLMPHQFGASAGELESVFKVYTVEPDSAADGVIDFSDQRIVGAAIINAEAVADSYPTVLTAVFDNVKFNQDIYITHKNLHADAGPVSYYFELEVSTLSLDEQTVATLKNIRNIGAE